jgi:hypothetical protein
VSDQTNDDIRSLRSIIDTQDGVISAYRGYKELIDEMIAIQRTHNLPWGGAHLPDQFANVLAALSGKYDWLELCERLEKNQRERDAFPLRRALRAIVAHWDEFGPEHGFGETIEAARHYLNQT